MITTIAIAPYKEKFDSNPEPLDEDEEDPTEFDDGSLLDGDNSVGVCVDDIDVDEVGEGDEEAEN